MAAGDVDTVARLVEELWLPTYRRARITTLQRWFRWLDDRGGFEDHPRAAGYAALLALATGRAADAERWLMRRPLALPGRARAGNHPSRPSPLRCALCCAAMVSSRCTRTPMRPHDNLRRRASCAR
jgi:hypothetical protein